MVIAMTNKSVIGLAEKDGKLLWSYPFVDEWQENIVTPLAMQNQVLISGIRNGTALLSLTVSEDGRWTVDRRWHNPEAAMYMSSPVLDGETVYAHSIKKKGQFVALNWTTGKILWQTEGRDAAGASLVLADNAVLISTVEGDLLVLRKDAEKFNLVRKYKLTDKPVYAHLALSGGDLLIKDDTHLRRYRGL